MHLRFSQDIESLLHRLMAHPLTLREILAETSERGFCLTITLLILPFLFPLPPGFSTILGGGCLLLSVQMALGRRTPWLPKQVAQFQFPKAFTEQLLKNVKRVTKLIEKFCRPRMLRVAKHPFVWQGNGLCMAWLAILLMLPIPLTNPIPTVAILVLAVATLEADGLLMCIGYLFTIINTLIFGLIGYLLWQAPQYLPQILR
ncbi:exopolysaccharide biosynthesis protein [Aphanothece sacrum]|uniref:Exopolysaccharide synthesis ExoD n=1 Tax=Aphanothece sacrum FPU1 TaxID=1920663 RepID=A0A401IKR2_APHSA|nr:exopolysaccharide biosynthesis protein [Aphanothece sacrum]GBF81839.1 exopolysaccharide synthesis ExoD [Aphanothece sacrum FPU1]GBF85658.1 exopolysaccharide synthesis ExoD [Aphanothece sacrum FPU3]